MCISIYSHGGIPFFYSLLYYYDLIEDNQMENFSQISGVYLITVRVLKMVFLSVSPVSVAP